MTTLPYVIGSRIYTSVEAIAYPELKTRTEATVVDQLLYRACEDTGLEPEALALSEVSHSWLFFRIEEVTAVTPETESDFIEIECPIEEANVAICLSEAIVEAAKHEFSN